MELAIDPKTAVHLSAISHGTIPTEIVVAAALEALVALPEREQLRYIYRAEVRAQIRAQKSVDSAGN